jgi:hypothetical protein
VESTGRESVSLLQVLLKLMLTYRKGDPGDSHLIISEWGGTWVVPSQVRVVWAVPEPDIGNLHIRMGPELSLLPACLTRSGSVGYCCPGDSSFLFQTSFPPLPTVDMVTWVV